MTYNKPEILVLGDAIRAIQCGSVNKSSTGDDGFCSNPTYSGDTSQPAYDLDE